MTPSALPDGDPAPADGALPASAFVGARGRSFSAYVHVPFCATRCGYCDFNTYTAADLGGAPGTSRDAYLDAVAREIALARRVVGERPLDTVFFGGGTPTLLDARELAGLLSRLRDAFGLAEGAEVTTEANPDSVTPHYLRALCEAGFTRVSFGMQSSVPHVLRVLDRTHTPGRALDAVAWARDAGFASVSLDLIYGTPGETENDWRASLASALSAAPDHVSAYSLIVEEGTPLARRVRRGEVPTPSDDVHADYYEIADAALTDAGYVNYETSNWAKPGHTCRHNLAYWRSGDWWGLGPGAHSHIGGVRWWNAKHPRTYAAALTQGRSPAVGRETLGDAERREERVLLELRLAEGLPGEVLTADERARAQRIVADGQAAWTPDGRLRLIGSGRLVADALIAEILA